MVTRADVLAAEERSRSRQPQAPARPDRQSQAGPTVTRDQVIAAERRARAERVGDVGENFVRGAAQVANGVLLGYAPEVQGYVLQGPAAAAGAMLRGENPIEAYQEAAPRATEEHRRFLDSGNPAARFVNEMGGAAITGGAVTNAVRGAASAASPVLQSLPRTATAQSGDVVLNRGANYAGNAVTGAIYGSSSTPDNRAVGASVGVLSSIPGTWAGNRISEWISGAASRASLPDARLVAQREALIDAARMNARAQAENAARLRGVTGDQLQAAIAEADSAALERVARSVSATRGPGPQAMANQELGERYGFHIARSQAENDWEGKMFLHEAASGLHGPQAQQLAQPLVQSQYDQIPAAVRGIAGDQSITDVPTAVGRMRQGMQTEAEASSARAADLWENQFHPWADRRLRTEGVTPSGRPGGIADVRNAIGAALGRRRSAMMTLPEWQRNHPQAMNLMRLLDEMEGRNIQELPLHDVDRVLEFRRAADTAYDLAQTNSDRGLVALIRGQASQWVRNATAPNGTLRARGANQTANLLEAADRASSQHAQNFQDNAVIRWMLAPAQGTREQAEQLPTDMEVAQRLFGGGNSGLNFQAQDVDALRIIHGVTGASSPEWQGLRQAALLRLTAGLDQDLANNQTPRIITTANLIDNALTNQREAMGILFTREELARLTDLSRVLRMITPPARSGANAINSGIVASRAARNIFQTIVTALRRVPGASAAVGLAQDLGDQARMSAELAGAREGSTAISRAVAQASGIGPSAPAAASAVSQRIVVPPAAPQQR